MVTSGCGGGGGRLEPIFQSWQKVHNYSSIGTSGVDVVLCFTARLPYRCTLCFSLNALKHGHKQQKQVDYFKQCTYLKKTWWAVNGGGWAVSGNRNAAYH